MAAKLANADVNVEVEIPLDEATPSDITDQVTEYFKLDGESETPSEAADETKPEVVTASFRARRNQVANRADGARLQEPAVLPALDSRNRHGSRTLLTPDP